MVGSARSQTQHDDDRAVAYLDSQFKHLEELLEKRFEEQLAIFSQELRANLENFRRSLNLPPSPLLHPRNRDGDLPPSRPMDNPNHNLINFSVILLYKDAKIFASGEGLTFHESQNMKGTVILPNGALYKLGNYEDLMVLFKILKDQCVNKMHVNIEVLPLDVELPKSPIYDDSDSELDNEGDSGTELNTSQPQTHEPEIEPENETVSEGYQSNDEDEPVSESEEEGLAKMTRQIVGKVYKPK
ncbi:hypothetical protein FNV43_RR12822 [Rhamnella rubrinervis]|uniref:Uncharacterized protein n=1 Tax=Rhamnella rubrinervis TaxID=2594499 RepID=A0A8K0MJ88_9ROSA|nr:hypothetical protein FNV43_RR12822 [Rhamnella rubrinervis]